MSSSLLNGHFNTKLFHGESSYIASIKECSIKIRYEVGGAFRKKNTSDIIAHASFNLPLKLSSIEELDDLSLSISVEHHLQTMDANILRCKVAAEQNMLEKIAFLEENKEQVFMGLVEEVERRQKLQKLVAEKVERDAEKLRSSLTTITPSLAKAILEKIKNSGKPHTFSKVKYDKFRSPELGVSLENVIIDATCIGAGRKRITVNGHQTTIDRAIKIITRDLYLTPRNHNTIIANKKTIRQNQESL